MGEPDPLLPDHLVAGRRAEDSACAYLLAHGLTVVARNVRVRGGEIDIVAREGAVLVFVEVRWRRSMRFGGAAASIGWRKRERMVHAAQAYLMRYRSPPACRLDVLFCNGILEQDGAARQDVLALSEHWQWVRGL